MPKRTDIKSILVIGAGPIVIGQACEFDYSGVQACKALKDEGYRVILINSNPATIMTDPGLVDATYVEPITPDFVARIIEKEKPDAILPTMGGQTALNTAMSLHRDGRLEKYGVELIGANAEAIDKAEDRLLFRDAMTKIGLECPKSEVVHNREEAANALDRVGLPAIIRPSFTLGGTGGGIAYNRDEYFEIVAGGVDASPVGEVLVEESVLGWKEYEMEVVRDRNDNCIIICSIENIDPMGVHTGDSVTVAPALTLTDKEYQIMRDASIACLREIGVDTGGSNVQFAVDPATGRMVVIEMNPRVSRSSALASKATGFPIAKVAARLAVGYTLDELLNDITGETPASFEPTIDYVVTKMPRFAFEKFPGAEALLNTSMKSVGEAMSIGRTFQESLQKALRSMETGLTGLNEIEIAKRIEAGQDKMIGGICESPMTITALLHWRDAINEGRILLRDVIDLEATQGGGAPGEGKGANAAPAPAAPPVPRPAMMPKLVRPAAPAVNGEGGEAAATEGGEDDEENALSLSALEEKLKPEVLRVLTKIYKVYIEMSKVQNRRLSTLARGQKPSADFEKSYEKHRKKIVELVRTVHINAARIEQLKLSLYDLNRKLMTQKAS